MRIFECPKCGQDISDSYQEEDPDTGIIAGWYCDKCDKGFIDREPDDFVDLEDAKGGHLPRRQKG